VIADKLFGPIRQVAYVVPELDAAMKAWNAQLGVGPFAVVRGLQPLTGSRYRGAPSGDVILDMGFAYIEDVQLELIEQRNQTPSVYREAIERGLHSLHHYGFWVEDFDTAYAHAVAHGFEAVVEAGSRGPGRMSYVESRLIPGLICELIEWTEGTRPYFDGVRRFLAGVDPATLQHEMDLASVASGGPS
jgi:hypothetical protein